MKMKVFLLAAAVVLLGCPATTNPVQHKSCGILKDMFTKLSSFNKSLTPEIFVEDLTDLTAGENRCPDKFFCKANEILQTKFGKEEGKKFERLLRTVQTFIDDKIPNCTEVQRNMTSTGVFKPVSSLLINLSRCTTIRIRGC